ERRLLLRRLSLSRPVFADLDRQSLIRAMEHRLAMEAENIELELTLRHATAVTAFLERFGLYAAGVDVLGFHGQTVL
ncbi:hypothetical protein ACC676_39770, partial [Rhizobium ruizarguesonis]